MSLGSPAVHLGHLGSVTISLSSSKPAGKFWAQPLAMFLVSRNHSAVSMWLFWTEEGSF